MVAWEDINFIILILKTIFYSFAELVHKILFLPLQNKIHIFAPPCNIL